MKNMKMRIACVVRKWQIHKNKNIKKVGTQSAKKKLFILTFHIHFLIAEYVAFVIIIIITTKKKHNCVCVCE